MSLGVVRNRAGTRSQASADRGWWLV